MISFRRFCDSQGSPGKSKFWKMKMYCLNYNLFLAVHGGILQLLLEIFSCFYLIKMMNPQLILAFFWRLKLIKTLFTYFNDKIKPKPSPDGTLSPKTILFSDGRYCTVLREYLILCYIQVKVPAIL